MILRPPSGTESVHSGAEPDYHRLRASTRPRLSRRAAAAMEYLFVLSLIVVAAMTGIGYFGKAVRTNLDNSRNTILDATSGK